MDLDLNSRTETLAEEAQKHEAFSAINLRHVRGGVAEALAGFGKFGLLEEYTKHDITHIDAMLAMYDWMIPEATRKLMTPADWLLVTLATYLHDFGLLATRDEFDNRGDVDLYQMFRRRIMDTDDPTVRDYRSQVGQLREDDAERFLYQEFVRTYHAQRIRAWLQPTADPTWGVDERISNSIKELFGSIEPTFLDDIGVVCESHHLDDMNDTRKYPLSKPYGRTHEEEANVQYAAMLLRTSDLLHITKDRVPSMAAVIVNPRNPKSQVEWAKQSAVRSVRPRLTPKNPESGIAPQSDTVEVHASFSEAEGYFGLTAYLTYAQTQIAQTFEWAKRNQESGVSEYLFPWRRIDVSNIEAKGFVTEPFEFSIDQGKILDLLTGHTLYNDTGVVVRELVQNALDAVRLQKHIEDMTSVEDPSYKTSYEPRIEVAWNSSDRLLCVTDNGVGMDQATIEQNFLRVGSSKYQDPAFRKAYPDFASISRFGIGVLSAFMVADDVSVSTSHPTETQARQLNLRDVHGQYLVRLLDKSAPELPEAVKDHGTSVCLKLRPSAELTEIEELLRRWIVFPDCAVTLTVDDSVPQEVGYPTVARALRNALVVADIAREVDSGLQGSFGQPIEIRSIRSGGLELAFAVQWSRWLEEWAYVRFEPERQQAEERAISHFGICAGGVRVTSAPPGFVFGGVAAMANAVGRGAPLTNVARSAFEKTEEYETLLGRVYSGYLDHISSEMVDMQEAREASLTRAAQEASYLAQDLVRLNMEEPDVFEKELRSLPALILEAEGARDRKSLLDLEALDELSSVESTAISSFEGVLRTVRGASSSSLRNLMGALGSGETLPSLPLICGLNNGNLLSRMFTGEWEVVRLESDDDSRTLRATWRAVGVDPLWDSAARRPQLLESGVLRTERGTLLGGASEDLSWILFARSTQIEVVGIDKSLVVCQGRLLVLPSSEFLDIEAATGEVPEAARRWGIAWLISLVTTTGSSRRAAHTFAGQLHTSLSPELRGEARWISRVVDVMKDAGLLEVLDEASVRLTLETVDLEPLDVSRWDARTQRDV